MLVVVPTYRRLECLPWVFESLARCELPRARDQRFLVCIANNCWPQRDAVEEVVARARARCRHLPWEWVVLHREVEMPPVDSWYSAVRDVAQEDEVVFFCGDDDLLTPWSLRRRADAAMSARADLLLARGAGGFYYVSSDSAVMLGRRSWLEGASAGVERLRPESMHLWGAVLLANHCFRFTRHFRSGLDRAFLWCEEQDWLDRSTRTLMLPYYLPLAIHCAQGSVYGLDSLSVIRGVHLREIERSPYGVSWNSGFLTLCALGVLGNADLRSLAGLEDARREQVRHLASWFATLFFDRRLDRKLVRETMRRVKVRPDLSVALRAAASLGMVLKDRLGMTGRTIREAARSEAVPVVDILNELSSLGARR